MYCYRSFGSTLTSKYHSQPATFQLCDASEDKTKTRMLLMLAYPYVHSLYIAFDEAMVIRPRLTSLLTDTSEAT